MPRAPHGPPVIGAATLFTSAIIFLNGLQIITSRLLDNTYQRLSRLRLQKLDVYR